MKRRFYTLTTGFIFLFVGLVHGLRAYYGWDFIVGGWMVPIWVSWLVVVVAFSLTYSALRLVQ